MAASKFKERLASMKSEWENSQGAYDQMFGGMKIPEGVYVARLQSAKIAASKASGKLLIRREHLIVEGEYKGMIAFDNMMLETPNGLVYVRRWIEMMGYECPPVENFEEDFEGTITAIVDENPLVKIRLTHSGDFTNVSIVEVLDQSGSSQEGTKESTPEESSYNGVTAGEMLTVFKKEKLEIGELDTENAEELFGELSQYEWDPSELADESIAVLTALGLLEGEGEGEESSEDAEKLEAVHQFCTAQDIEYESDDTLEMLCERIDAFEYPKDKLTDEEVDLLKSIGMEGNIKETEPKPEPKPAKKALAKKAPAKKAAPSRKAPPKKKK